MKRFLFLVFFITSISWLHAQDASRDMDAETKEALQRTEQRLKGLGDVFVNDTILENRRKALYEFIPAFVKSLKTPNSFYFTYPELSSISVLYPPDSTFRIITWQFYLGEGLFRYYGAIQMNSEDLKLYPLTDQSDTMSFHTQATLKADNWMGALYYSILQNQINGKPYYTLLGYDGNDYFSDRKLMEILSFDDKGKPVFGAPIIHMQLSKNQDLTLNRFYVDYKYDAQVTLAYDTGMHLIVFDHTAPMDTLQVGLFFSYVPDGTYEAFEFKGNRWEWIEKVFHYAINENDNPPVPYPIKKAGGR